MPAVDQLLRDAGWRPRDLEGVAVATGPGSFTGLRIGVSAAKGLALALSIPLAVVPTLDAMAAALPFAEWPVCPVLVARRDEVYVSLYRWGGTGMRRDWDYLALPPHAVGERLQERVILTGEGAPRITSPFAVLAPRWRWSPSAAIVGHLGVQRLRAGKSVGAAELVPLYVRPSQAELTRRAVAIS
jgi:tRNA threonylcarbamoyladenosine biosynthesis protein TsaB